MAGKTVTKDAAGQTMKDVLAARHLDREADAAAVRCNHPGVLAAKEEMRKNEARQEGPKVLGINDLAFSELGAVVVQLKGELKQAKEENAAVTSENKRLAGENARLKTENSRLKRQVPTDSGFHP